MAKNIAVLTLLFLFLLLLRAPLLNVPLERDEGEYACVAQQMMKGHIPYKDAFDQKPPLIFLIYALAFLVFGQTTIGIHLMLLVFIFIGAAFLFFIGRRLANETIGLAGAVTFCLISSNMRFMGSSANTEHFMNTMVIAGLFFLLYALEKETDLFIFLSGLFLGMAFLIRAPSFVNIPFFSGLICVDAISKKRRASAPVKRNAVLLGGFLTPVALSFAVFYLLGALADYLFCVYKYNVAYANIVPPSSAFHYFSLSFPLLFSVTWPLIAACLISLVFAGKDKKIVFCLAWLICSFFGTSAGFIYRHHYFIQTAPALAIFFAYGLQRIIKKLSLPEFGAYAVYGMCLAPLILSGISDFGRSPTALSKIYFGRMNPFAESAAAAKYVEDNTAPDNKILVIGSEPQIYFYAKREAATKYIYFYPFFLKSSEGLRMQKEALREISENRPPYIVFINERFSFLSRGDSDLYIIDELGKLVMSDYRPVGCVMNFADFPSEYYFGKEFEERKKDFPDIDNLSLNSKKPKIVIFGRKER